jgi:hypothetical protein
VLSGRLLTVLRCNKPNKMSYIYFAKHTSPKITFWSHIER